MLCTGTMRVKTRIYVDGFNLYYGAVKATPFKWLDPVALSRLLLPPSYTIEKLRYFTARVSGKIDRKAPARQEAYLKALSTLPETELHFGNFLGKTKWRPLTNLASCRPTHHHTARRRDTASGQPSRRPQRRQHPAGRQVPRTLPAQQAAQRQATARCRNRRILHRGRKRLGRQSRGPPPERCLRRPVRRGCRDIERH